MNDRLHESVWRRGWLDTKKAWTNWQFFVLDAVVAVVVGGIFQWYWGLLVVIFGMLCVWIGATALAPIKQRDKSRKRVIELENSGLSCIDVKSITGEPASYEKNNYSAWAELKIKNTSTDVSLGDVSVQIVELVLVHENQDEHGAGLGVYHLTDSLNRWSPANVYWSERNAPAKQLSLPIPPGATRCALIAFHSKSSSGLGSLNTPTPAILLESKIVVEVSSPNMLTYRGEYYIEYHPPWTDKFEFIEWDSWCISHKIIASNVNAGLTGA